MALHGKEKIWFLINRLQDEREITPKDEPIGLHLANDLNRHYELPDLLALSEKLEKEDNAIKLVSLPTDQTGLKVLFELLPGFDAYIEKIEEDPDYLEWSGKKPKPKKPYFDPNRQVDFSKTSEQNKDKYISVGQIEDLQKMPEAKREEIMQKSLTEAHRKDITEFDKTANELVKSIVDNLKIEIPKIHPLLSDVNFALPPNYEAEQVKLLRQLIDQQEANKKPAKIKDGSFAITYTSSRQVLLNDTFQISKPNFNSENEQVFGFLYSHPNERFTKKTIEEALNIKITKDFHKIIENLGFKADLAKVFFNISKNNIEFRNPVSSSNLEEMGMTIIRL